MLNQYGNKTINRGDKFEDYYMTAIEEEMRNVDCLSANLSKNIFFLLEEFLIFVITQMILYEVD
jgi:hypothetical protein